MYICSHSLYEDKVKYEEDDLKIDEFKKLQSKFTITFDDGYRGIYSIIDNIKDFNNPIIIFICPGFIESHCSIWWLELSNYIFDKKNSYLDFIYKNKQFIFKLNSFTSRKKTYYKLSLVFKNLNFKEQELILDRILGSKIRHDFSERFLTWEMIKNLSEVKNVIIGSHTMNHPNLINEDLNNISKELLKSKNVIETKLSQKCDHFAIPFGGKDSFNKIILDNIYRAGYKYIYSTLPSLRRRETKYKLIGRISSKVNQNNFMTLKSKYYIKALLNNLK